MGLNVAMDAASGGGYAVTGIGSYARSDGAAIAFRANAVQTNASPGTYTYGFYSESSSGANLNYGFYQAGSSTLNYFNGWVGVGATNTPYGNVANERMTLEGNVNDRSWLSIRNTNSGSSSIAGVVVNAYGNSWALEMGSTANNSNALNFTKDIYGSPQVMAYMATSGVMTFYGDNGNRPVQIGGGYVRTKGETGGWQIGYYTQDSAGTIKGGFGAAGSNTTQNYNFIGPDATNSFARFTANGMGLAGTDPAASGVGITFPATQSASSNANTLDDYEEGTWTAVFSDGTNNTSGVGCWYTKIGNLVTVDFPIYGISTTGLSTSAHIRVTGLPFAAGQTADSELHVSGANPAVLGQLTTGGTSIFLYGAGSGGANINALTISNGFVSSTDISCWGQMSYRV
jgi:hypothetical protein